MRAKAELSIADLGDAAQVTRTVMLPSLPTLTVGGIGTEPASLARFLSGVNDSCTVVLISVKLGA